jgi:thioredoxin 1
MTSFKELINSSPVVLIDFHADWCAPCKTLSPILEDLKRKRGDDLKLVKIDIDKNPSLSQMLNVRSVPTILLYKEGQLKWRRSGVVPLSSLEGVPDK